MRGNFVNHLPRATTIGEMRFGRALVSVILFVVASTAAAGETHKKLRRRYRRSRRRRRRRRRPLTQRDEFSTPCLIEPSDLCVRLRLAGHAADSQAESKSFPGASLFDFGLPGMNRGERRQSGLPAACTADDISDFNECLPDLSDNDLSDNEELCDYYHESFACYPKCTCEDPTFAAAFQASADSLRDGFGCDGDFICGGGGRLSFLADVAATGRFSHPACNETRTMSTLLTELAEDPSLFISGGMSRDKGRTGRYTWICFAGHPCMEAVGNETSSEDDRMCYVMERREDRSGRSGGKSHVFHAWGLNSELGLCKSTSSEIKNKATST